uniref:hypothetical protein n=1 Tax=Vibrio cholerae TaxID=666 RepID=UPI003F58F095
MFRFLDKGMFENTIGNDAFLTSQSILENLILTEPSMNSYLSFDKPLPINSFEKNFLKFLLILLTGVLEWVTVTK